METDQELLSQQEKYPPYGVVWSCLHASDSQGDASRFMIHGELKQYCLTAFLRLMGDQGVLPFCQASCFTSGSRLQKVPDINTIQVDEFALFVWLRDRYK